MSNKLATSYANLFIYFFIYFEDKHVHTYLLQPFLWERYIYNIFLIWTFSLEELDDFINYLNGYHSTIKLTQECQ